jgi:hypothetical protein
MKLTLNEHIAAAAWIMSSTITSRVSCTNTQLQSSTNNTCKECFAQAQVTQYREDFHPSYVFPYWIIYNQQIYLHGDRSGFEPELPIHIMTLLPEMPVAKHFWPHLAQFSLEWEMMQRNFYRKSKHTFYIQCLSKKRHLWENVEKYCRAGQATDDNMAHAHCVLDT